MKFAKRSLCNAVIFYIWNKSVKKERKKEEFGCFCTWLFWTVGASYTCSCCFFRVLFTLFCEFISQQRTLKTCEDMKERGRLTIHREQPIAKHIRAERHELQLQLYGSLMRVQHHVHTHTNTHSPGHTASPPPPGWAPGARCERRPVPPARRGWSSAASRRTRLRAQTHTRTAAGSRPDLNKQNKTHTQERSYTMCTRAKYTFLRCKQRLAAATC